MFKSIENRDEIIGTIEGNLQVLSVFHHKTTKTMVWKVTCKCLLCGREDYTCALSWLKHSHSKSCGCAFDQAAHARNLGKSKEQKYGVIPGCYISNIKSRSKKLNMNYNVTPQYLSELWEAQKGECALTGIKLDLRTKKGDKYANPASIDRIDSEQPYNKGNIQWVHKDVNQMKFYFDSDYFVEMCRKVVLKKGLNI